MIGDTQTRSRLLGTFPFLLGAEEGFRRAFWAAAVLVHLPAGQSVGRQGGECAHLALLVCGTARVYRLGESGREITLYRIRPGESCVLTASCILRHGVFPAFAECETPVEAVLVSQREVEHWIREFPAWRAFVFGLVSDRLLEVIELLDAVAFGRLDRRLAAHLSARLGSDRRAGIAVTHRELAAELGSSREVVSRLLATMEEKGILSTGRGLIRVLDPERLAAMSAAT
jgi:CRP/FNR family transcriptional regulator